ncbi:MAG: GMC family oxidoreductase [Candidatus Glassbacteria bacterium]|nr:GMC family oxidoreductase [Candidatus Glassbacteria bacterium]
MSPLSYDAIVVGVGAAGSVVTEALSGAGWKVLALDEGPWYNPFRDFSRGPARRMPAGIVSDPDTGFTAGMTKAVGGSMVFYAGVFFRLHESDFQTRSKCGCGVDWPVSYQELAPYYRKVEVFTGASGGNKNIFEVPREPYPNPPHKLSGAAWMFEKGARAAGYHPAPTPSSILSRAYRGRPACTYCNMCGEGCMVGDHGSPLMTFIPEAKKHGADIRPLHKVLTIETDRRGRVSGVVFRDREGNRAKAVSDLVVLTAGAAHNPVILMRSRGPAHPEGLASKSGLLGRNLMLHKGGRYMARFPKPVKGFMGVSGGVNVQDFYEGAPGADFLRGYTLYVSMTPRPPSRFADWYLEDLWGKDLVEAMDSYDRMVRVAVVGEDQARPENRVIPDPDHTDEDGLPLVRISYSESDNERSLFSHAVGTSREICRAGGADDWELFWSENDSAHILGTCRMGDNPKTSVVDRWGACHDVKGLYICDSSVFPTSGAVNPACTVLALAARTADRLIRRKAR